MGIEFPEAPWKVLAKISLLIIGIGANIKMLALSFVLSSVHCQHATDLLCPDFVRPLADVTLKT